MRSLSSLPPITPVFPPFVFLPKLSFDAAEMLVGAEGVLSQSLSQWGVTVLSGATLGRQEPKEGLVDASL